MSSTWFDEAYKGTPPWEIDGPQPVVVALADEGEIRSPVLDVGCGTGENALFLAARGHEVVGVDLARTAVAAARRKAAARGLTAEFLVHDALDLGALGRRFATVLDTGLFHLLGDDERLRFRDTVTTAILPGGRCYVLCFSELEPTAGGPRRFSQPELRATFDTPPLRVLSIAAAEMASALPGVRRAWLASVERVPDAGPV